MRIIYFTITCFLLCLTGYGQDLIRPSIYFLDMNYYNPAAVSIDSSENYSISAYSKNKFVDNEEDIWNKPMNILLNHAGRIGSSNSFYTVSYINDRYSFFNRNILYAGYSRQKKWGKSGILSFGSRIVANFDNIKWDKYQLPHTQSGNTMKFTPDLEAGVQYLRKRFKAGLSVKNLLSLSAKEESSELLKNRRTAYLNLSYTFKLVKILELSPYTLVHMDRNTVFDAGLYVLAFNRIGASYLLRINELRSIYTVDVKLNKQFSVGAAIDKSSLTSDNNLDLVVKYNF